MLPSPTNANQPQALPVTSTPRPSINPEPLPTEIPESLRATNNCIAIVGDSVTHGGVTYQIPGTGYVIALTKPLASFVADSLAAATDAEIRDLRSLDRGVSHTGISTTNHPSYFGTGTYTRLLQDNCHYTVIMPWLNDISPEIEAPAAARRHVVSLVQMAYNIVSRTPYTNILIFDYYHGATSDFALRTWAFGFVPENVEIFNTEIQRACDFGALSKIAQVTCFRTSDAFAGMGIDHVLGPTTKEEFYESLVSAIGPQQEAWVQDFFSDSSRLYLLGDGVHLSSKGKRALANYIVGAVAQLAPLAPN
jgi:hypothetical protein